MPITQQIRQILVYAFVFLIALSLATVSCGPTKGQEGVSETHATEHSNEPHRELATSTERGQIASEASPEETVAPPENMEERRTEVHREVPPDTMQSAPDAGIPESTRDAQSETPTPDQPTPPESQADQKDLSPGPCVQKTPVLKPYTGTDANHFDACGAGYPFGCPSQYKSGISLTMAGPVGKTYAEEYLYFDHKVDDTRVIYLRANTKIKLAHNTANTIFSSNDAVDGGAAPVAINTGKIRYKIDRDMQFKYVWAPYGTNTTFVLPAYTAPFSLSQLTYAPGVPVVGTIGPVTGISIKNRSDYYWRGHKGPFGDEWHTLQIADDDSHLGGGGSASEKWASDGKIFSLVVNPKHPVLQLQASQTNAQFYTTPAKTYFLPKIHTQRSYVTQGVTIHLANIMNDKPVLYQLDKGPWVPYTTPLKTDSWGPGIHKLSYTYNPCFIKTRVFVKNPGFASVLAQKTWLGFGSQKAFSAIQQRMLTGDLNTHYTNHKKRLQQPANLMHKGADGTRAPYRNRVRKDGVGFAVIALVEGIAKSKDWATAAKKTTPLKRCLSPHHGPRTQ